MQTYIIASMQTRLTFDKIAFKIQMLLCTLTLCAAFGSHAQGSLKFPVTNYDFGNIPEEGGHVEYEFLFINESDVPIKITYVKASCGCTTPGWTKEEVMPGDSGFVKARYNPRNRPGKFRKSLRITTSDQKSNQTLYINGLVQPKPRSPEEQFPVAFGDLRMSTKSVNLGKISTEKPVLKSFDVYNNSEDYITLSADDFVLAKHMTLTLVQDSLGPRAMGQMILKYDPIRKNDFGYVSDLVELEADSSAKFSVMAVIEEYFPPMSAEELDNAPKLAVSEQVYDFGKITQGTFIEKEFELTNVGGEKLSLRAIKSNCDCITYEFKNRDIKKGKSQTLKILLDTSGLRGNQYKSVSLFSNDPVSPTQIISIRGTVSVD